MLKIVKKFAANKSGNFGMMAAGATAVLLMSGSLAINYSHATNLHAEIQSATDSAVLAAAAAYDNLEEKKRKKKGKALKIAQKEAEKYFESALNKTPDIFDEQIKITISKAGVLQARSKASFEPFMGVLFNSDTTTVSTVAETGLRKDVVKGDIAVVLDVTGSMSERGRFDPMREAARDFVNAVITEEEAPFARIAIVPFSSRVNYGLNNINFFNRTPDRWSNPESYDGVGTPLPWTSSMGERGYFVNGDDYHWLGCAEPRLDVAIKSGQKDKPKTPINPLSTPYSPADDNLHKGRITSLTSCPTPIVPLTNKRQLLLDSIDNMTSQGSTRLDVGLMAGWEALSQDMIPAWPADRAVDPSRKRIMVFMSDGGQNTLENSSKNEFDWLCINHDRAKGAGDKDCDKAADKALLDYCKGAKDEGIWIYSVAYSNDSDAKLMKKCSSGDDFAFKAGKGNIDDIYEDIAEDIEERLRYLSK